MCFAGLCVFWVLTSFEGFGAAAIGSFAYFTATAGLLLLFPPAFQKSILRYLTFGWTTSYMDRVSKFLETDYTLSRSDCEWLDTDISDSAAGENGFESLELDISSNILTSCMNAA